MSTTIEQTIAAAEGDLSEAIWELQDNGHISDAQPNR